MDELYRKNVEGLESGEPETVLESALWLVFNPDKVEEDGDYMRACEILYTASVQDLDCLNYLDERLNEDLIFKAQLFSQVYKEGQEQEIKEAVSRAIENMIEQITQVKSSSTEMAAQIYSYIEGTGDPLIIQKAKQLL